MNVLVDLWMKLLLSKRPGDSFTWVNLGALCVCADLHMLLSVQDVASFFPAKGFISLCARVKLLFIRADLMPGLFWSCSGHVYSLVKGVSRNSNWVDVTDSRAHWYRHNTSHLSVRAETVVVLKSSTMRMCVGVYSRGKSGLVNFAVQQSDSCMVSATWFSA